jgi:hypothetical protein
MRRDNSTQAEYALETKEPPGPRAFTRPLACSLFDRIADAAGIGNQAVEAARIRRPRGMPLGQAISKANCRPRAYLI